MGRQIGCDKEKYLVTNHRRGKGCKRLSRVFQNDEGDGYLVLIRITPDEEGRFGFNLKVCCECAFRLCAVEQAFRWILSFSQKSATHPHRINKIKQSLPWGCRGSSVAKVLAVQTGGPDCSPQKLSYREGGGTPVIPMLRRQKQQVLS